MALDLGELYGTIGLDDRPFQGTLDRAADALEGFGGRGVVIAGAAGLAVAGAFGVSIAQGMNVEAANDKLSAQLGLSTAESERIGGVAGSLYADAYGESLEDVNTAVGAVMTSIEGMTSASDADLSRVTAKALDFATAFEVDVTRSAQVAGQMISSGLVANADEAFDLLVAGSQRVPAALREDLLDAVDEYGQFFATLGYTGEEAFAVLVEGSEKGMYGIDKAGDAIKEFTIRATDMSEASKGAYETIGLDAETMANKILAGGETAGAATQQIIDGLLGIEDPATRANTAIALFGTPLEDLNATEIPAFLQSLTGGSDAMEGFAGAADRMGATLNDNAATSLTELKRRAEAAFGRLGNWALPIVNDLTASMADGFDPALAAVAGALDALLIAGTATFDYIAANQTLFTVIAGVILTLLLPAIIAWGVQATIAAVANVAAWITSGIAAATGAALHVVSLTLVGSRWIWASVQALAGAARMAAAWLIAMGPIGWAIAALIAVVAAVVMNWDKVKAFTKAAWDWVVAQVKKVPGLLVGFFLNWTLPGLIIKHWDTIKSTVSKGASAVIEYVKSIPGRITGLFSDAGSLLSEVGRDIMRGLRDGIEAGFDWVRDKLQGVGRIIPGWLKSVLGINSPSTVMRDEVGFWIPAGVADGITSGSPLVQSAMEGMMASLVTPKVDMAASDVNPFGAPGLGGTAGGIGGPAVVQHVHPAPGMDEKEVGDFSADRLAFALDSTGSSNG